MPALKSFDGEIEITRGLVYDLRAKTEQSAAVLASLAHRDGVLSSPSFDAESDRVDAIGHQGDVAQAAIADLIIRLEKATSSLRTQFEGMKIPTSYERFVGYFSRQRSQRLRMERIRGLSLSGDLQDLLARSNAILGLLKEQRGILDRHYREGEANLVALIERRKLVIADLEEVQGRVQDLDQQSGGLEPRIEAAEDMAERVSLEAQRVQLAAESDQALEDEQRLVDDARVLERYVLMFQGFVDSLNGQIAAQNTLINKLTIDTEQRIVLGRTLDEPSMVQLRAGFPAVAEADRAVTDAQQHIGDLLALQEKNMLSTQDIERRKKLADDAFVRRFKPVVEAHGSRRFAAG